MIDSDDFDDSFDFDVDDLSEYEFDEDLVFAGMREGLDEERGKLH